MTVSLDQLRRCHVAVDLGAARTRVFVKGAGLVVDEPSVAAVNTRTGALIAVGALAEKMTGRTPDYIRVVRPVSGGTVVDIEMAQRMLRHLLGEKLRRQAAHSSDHLLPALSARLPETTADPRTLLFGPAPADDTALIRLADQLDALEREVRTS